MSCFIVKAETMAKMADYIETMYNAGFNYTGFEMPQTLHKYIAEKCTDARGNANAEKIYNELYILNYNAYNSRYKETEKLAWAEYKHQSFVKPNEHGNGHYNIKQWQYQAVKHLQCIIYQCSEDGNKENELLNGLINLKNTLMAFIVMNQEEYKAADWS